MAEPLKCTFEVSSRKFLGFLVNQRGVEANLDKIQALLNMQSPTKVKQVQSLAGRLAVADMASTSSPEIPDPTITPAEISSSALQRTEDTSSTPNESRPTTETTATDVNKEADVNPFARKKRAKTSVVWNDFKEVILPDNTKKTECIHCKAKLAITVSGSTTHLSRHLNSCVRRILFQKQQQRFFQAQAGDMGTSGETDNLVPILTNGKFEMVKMRELVANWVLMHEHPFTVVEEEGFNDMQRYAIPQWERINNNMCKNDCVTMYEREKTKLKNLLKTIDKISLTTDLWKSSNQKIEYMVLTGHFIDSNWRLQKRVLNFVYIPPPRTGILIKDLIYKCAKEWGIENKVFTISVDNATSNDTAIRILKDNFSINKSLVCGGKLFHVRCYTHIMNLMVQDGLTKIRYIVEDVRDSVAYIKQSESRFIMFLEIVQLLRLPHRKLILDCKTRWNSTYEMLITALKFKNVFLRYRDKDPHYDCCPDPEDWVRVEKVCEVLEVFNTITNIISGSDYPTANLFLSEVFRVKVMLDAKAMDANDFIRDMVKRMKKKFDKYWGECNLLMCVASVVDPRCKKAMLEYCFPRMYEEIEAQANMLKVKNALYEIYQEYVDESQSFNNEQSAENRVVPQVNVQNPSSSSGFALFTQHMKVVQSVPPEKSELDSYLEEECYISDDGDDPTTFDALQWWKVNTLKYRLLSRMARDILAIPITTVASEATFSAGNRVIETYRSSLSPETVQVLLCGGDWCRNLRGLKRKNKEQELKEQLGERELEESLLLAHPGEDRQQQSKAELARSSP
ncbi:zinc finger BED domain-containing protein RICESLEEPER 2-like [Pistacia vera]|uniref:zinc finger BED domain-containing protein RICESLEEPER 2-like n=1 Tax=Pistacia vera TaxID=55513 RepID=UPI0012631302|nr:zinc finger BED domain-containing protein RICESLEEPER 2-like [Pistacia vera]